MKNIHKADSRCPKCGKLLIPPFGNPQSSILLVGDFPGYQESIQGVPIAFRRKVTETRSGDILKDELNRVGIALQTTLITNLWRHQKDEKGCDLSLHVDALASLFADRTHVLLMGSDVTQAFLGVKFNVVSGLQVKVKGFPKVHFWASPNPSLLLGGQPIGELRLAFSRFAQDVKNK